MLINQSDAPTNDESIGKQQLVVKKKGKYDTITDANSGFISSFYGKKPIKQRNMKLARFEYGTSVRPESQEPSSNFIDPEQIQQFLPR